MSGYTKINFVGKDMLIYKFHIKHEEVIDIYIFKTSSAKDVHTQIASRLLLNLLN